MDKRKLTAVYLEWAALQSSAPPMMLLEVVLSLFDEVELTSSYEDFFNSRFWNGEEMELKH